MRRWRGWSATASARRNRAWPCDLCPSSERLWAALVAVGAALAFQDVLLGGVIALAMMINILVAAVSGSLLPSLLSLLGVDPAIAGGVVLTTITDVAGFFSFLGLATLVYA